MGWVVPAIATVGGMFLKGKSDKKQRDSERAAVADKNAADESWFTMTPEEKAQYFSTGVSKINEGYNTATGLADKELSARGMGGDAYASRLAQISAGRGKSIGDLWSNLVATAMKMRTAKGQSTLAPAAQSTGNNLMSSFGSFLGGMGQDSLSGYFGKKFG